jgi:hypothetical protein
VGPHQADGLVEGGVAWLVATRNADGGWGDTTDSVSNISTTALVWSALAFGRTPGAAAAAESAAQWIARAAGSSAPRALAGIENPSLKGLLRRVVGKIFNDLEVKGWCSEFEARNAAGREARSDVAGGVA